MGQLYSVGSAVPVVYMGTVGLWAIYRMSDGGYGCYREGKAEGVRATYREARETCERRMRMVADQLGRTPGAN